MVNDCIYLCYCNLCDKFYNEEKQLYGYSDLTDYPCKFLENQARCKNYVPKQEKL